MEIYIYMGFISLLKLFISLIEDISLCSINNNDDNNNNKFDETIDHIISACPILVKEQYIKRHD